MKTNFNILGVAWLCLLPLLLPAQEILTGFYHGNVNAPVISRTQESLALPFYDDFTDAHRYPDSLRWADRDVFVNSGFPSNPATRNAATFDVLDDAGRVYDYAISNPFIAEYLTSAPIRLDSVFGATPKALTPADSVYLSFYYQPQGHGNAPESNDSLVLEFYSPSDTLQPWKWQWSASGQTLQEFLNDSTFVQIDSCHFRRVMIPVKDPDFFTSEFRFRFYNYASIAKPSEATSRGNDDIWNIDMVYLDCDRSINDHSYPKICFTGPEPTFLKRYKSMPYKHYRANAIANINEEFAIQTSNLDKNAHNAHYQYAVEQVNGAQSYTYLSNAPIILAPETFVQNDTTILKNLFAISYDRDTASFVIRHYLSDSTCNPPMTDSIVYHQGFYNYFAYDDGIPEMGYGVKPSSGAFAVQFELSELDTLSGVQILFNHTLNDANNYYFDIVIWKDNNGKPGDEVYRMANRRPIWEDQLYQFTFYPFDRMVRQNGTFYIGIVQKTDHFINIGFDASNDNSAYNFINVTGRWQQSAMKGTIMLRPVVGKAYYISVDETPAEEQVSLYPNPVRTTLHIDGIDNGEQIIIYDLMGRIVMQEHFAEEISVNGLRRGLYLLNIITTDGTVISKRITVQP